MDDLHPRVRAVCDLMMLEVREFAGRHEYDGRVPDLSRSGVRAALDRLGRGGPLDDEHDEAHLAAFEAALRVSLGELEQHRVNPLLHLDGFDLAGYDKEYAPAEERRRARDTHLSSWPESADAAVSTLDRVNAPVARALLPAVRGLAHAVPADVPDGVRAAALEAHGRFVRHLERAAAEGDPSARLGAAQLASLMGTGEALQVDLDRLAERADVERDRLTGLLAEASARIDPSRPALEVARELVRDHPSGEGVMEAAREVTEEAIAFTRERGLVPYADGECRVGPTPESRRWSVAMVTWAAPAEPEGPTWYHITPPDPAWPDRDIEEWLQLFSATTLPAITVHEVAPGHYSHGRALREAVGDVRRTLFSSTFVEGWAHYAEEVCVEEGFRADDPRFAIGVWLEALVRVTRLACALGVHAGEMTVEEGARRFESDTHLAGPAALSEAQRATFDPTYGRYTWGKLEIMALRERAREAWGAEFSLSRFHRALLDLGAPPLGLIGNALR
ncbi:MAG: DUF885 family protein [Streptosporangiales bacterium]|nr:DUF885 family protein [Streptosporangiales bacterium]